jgi:hypothetical protein
VPDAVRRRKRLCNADDPRGFAGSVFHHIRETVYAGRNRDKDAFDLIVPVYRDYCERYADGKIKTPSTFYKSDYYLDEHGCKRFAAMLQEAADFIANYDKDSLASLEKEQAELRERLAAVNKGLRKARRAAK